ncbi:MAG TPA: hypothetical protein VFE07_16695 [Marmoricola sp.]|nr:hypothetical protein [Marmoricola sp.]
MTHDTLITALAPVPEPFDPVWSRQTLADIRSEERPAALRRRVRRPVLIGAAAAVLTLSTATAVAVGGPEDAIRGLLTQFIEQPNTTGNGLGKLDDPELVAQFRTENGLFTVWVATPTAADGVCYAYSDGTWDGVGNPTKDALDYGCGGEIWAGPDHAPETLTRPDQLGGFFKDTDGPMVYGISPYPDAVSVRVQGDGVDRTLPVRPDSHGYGAALPEAGHTPDVTLTFLDANGQVLGSKHVVAPIG